jgi:adenine-specific DNA-methyltransferase
VAAIGTKPARGDFLQNQSLAVSHTPAGLRAQLRNQNRATAERSQIASAESISHCAVVAFWQALGTPTPLTPPPGAYRPLAEDTKQAAQQFGRLVAKLPRADAAGQLGLLYTSLLPQSWRSRHGVFFTPAPLVERLLDQAKSAGIQWHSASVIDPAAGAGAFLVAVARRMTAALTDCDPAFVVQNVSARLRGSELDPFSAWMAQVLIEAELLPQITASGRKPSRVVTVANSLTAEVTRQFDLVVGNPPFGRSRLEPALRRRYARSLYGHANLYGMFLDLGVQLCKPNGLISFLTPSSFLAGEYFKNLRALLWELAPPVSLDFVTVRKGVFEEVLQETVLATYRRGGQRSRASVSFFHPAPDDPVAAERAGDFELPDLATAPWFLPRHFDEAPLAARLRHMPDRLEDWGYGVSTGPLVWNRHKPQFRDRTGKDSVPVVWAESVGTDGQFRLQAEKRGHRPFFCLQTGDDWLVVRRPCVLIQRTTAKEQSRRLIAAEMGPALFRKYPGVTVENHLNMLIPLVARPLVSPGLLAAFLNTMAADKAFRCLSGSVAVSAYELENLPLPPADELVAVEKRTRSSRAFSKAVAALYKIENAG